MDKKQKIKALEVHFGVKATYLGVPSCAYEIKTEDEIFTIERTGAIKNSNGDEITIEMILNENQPESEIEISETTESGETFIDEFEIEFPFKGHTGVTLQNIVNMLTSKQKLITRAFEIKELLLDETFAEDLSHKEVDTVEQFRAAFLEIGPGRCPGLIFDFEKETFVLRLLGDQLDQEKIVAFTDLAVFINKNARTLKNCSFKPAQDENPKYAFRTWLIRLGMNGEAYKVSRKALLGALEGSSAFRKPKEEAKEL